MSDKRNAIDDVGIAMGLPPPIRPLHAHAGKFRVSNKARLSNRQDWLVSIATVS